MSDTTLTQAAEPSEEERTLLLVAYVLYGLAPFTGGLTAVAGVIINHLKVAETANTFLGSHHRWLLRTFWFSLLWIVLCTALMFTILLIPVAWIGYVAAAVWSIYRVVRGAILFADRKPAPV
jgi:uncharacterized membrane protein